MNREELLFAVRALDRSHDGADRAGERVVKQRGDEYAEDDRPGPFVARGQQQGQQLGFVTDFRQGDHARRDEEGFQSDSPRPVEHP